jgi:apolipoprotein N-acyltransferase
MFVDGEGVGEAWSAKVYLVAFAEALPFRPLLGPFIEGRGGEWNWVSGGFTPGVPGMLVRVGETDVGSLVCYEQMYPALARNLRNAGAQFQVVITNDAWFGPTMFQRYQADAVRLRAIENRTDIVRAANTGISGFVDSRGRYYGKTPLFEEAVRVRDIRLSSVRTVYDRTGDVVVWVTLVALGAVVLRALVGRRG